MKKKTLYCCQKCGAQYNKWIGRCEECGTWGQILEESPLSSTRAESVVFTNLEYEDKKVPRELSGISEFDYICGGGAVKGTSILIGGDPGIGKSTLLLQVIAGFAKNNKKCVYFSGEESTSQICLRANRLGLSGANVKLASETNLEKILSSLDGDEDFIVIDSVQTLASSNVESFAGSVSQVKACSNALIHHAKTKNVTIFLIGHINKDGALAGPKVLEHMVDVVLYFEEESGNSYRILRAIKNRYGSCNDIAIFEMQANGLYGVSNPSCFFMSSRQIAVPGTVVFGGIHGDRPILVEIQALVSKTYSATPRRTVVGWDMNRLFMLLAVLESKTHSVFYNMDVYLNVVGGLKINEPGADLAVALALLSARQNVSINSDLCAFGEVCLTGEIRRPHREMDRIKEAEKLGFKSICTCELSQKYDNMTIYSMNNICDVADFLKNLK